MAGGKKGINELVKEREHTHGDTEWNMRCIGTGWHSILEGYFGHEIPEIPAFVVALMQDYMKTSRAVCGTYMDDHYDDKGGYTKIARDCHKKI